MKKSVLVLLLLVVIAGGGVFATYNSMVTMDEKVDAEWAQVENQLKRRSDLIPNLVKTVKAYAAHEEGVFLKVAEARKALAGASSVKDVREADARLTGALSGVLAIAENYPELKADKNFLQLQDEIAGTENRLSVARRDYNIAVSKFNASIRRLPRSLIAQHCNVSAREYFKVDKADTALPEVSF